MIASLLWRIIIAVICCIVVFTLLAPVFRVLQLSPSADALLIIRVCVAGLALLYVLAGNRLLPPPAK